MPKKEKEKASEAPEKEKASPKVKAPIAETISSSIQSNSKLIRSRSGEVYQLCKSNAWGHYLSPAKDPDGIDLSEDELEGMKLVPNFPKIPSHLWSRYIELCFHLCPTIGKLSDKFHDSQLEVGVCLLRKADDLTQWKIVVPKQVVSGASVKADLTKNIDIETGEEYTQFPPEGWRHAGSSHSHNTMSAFFSSVDDKSELNVPGMHIVIGHIDHKKQTYEWVASVVVQGMRKNVVLRDVVVTDFTTGVTFHPKVTDYVQRIADRNKEMLGPRKFTFPGQKSKEEMSLDVLSIKDIGKASSGEWDEDPYWRTWFFGNNEKSKVSDTDRKGKLKKEEYEDINSLLFGKDGKPTAFYRGLDKHNSDLFDGDEDLLGADDDAPLALLADAVTECLRQGWSFPDIMEAIEETKSDYEEELLNATDDMISYKDLKDDQDKDRSFYDMISYKDLKDDQDKDRSFYGHGF